MDVEPRGQLPRDPTGRMADGGGVRREARMGPAESEEPPLVAFAFHVIPERSSSSVDRRWGLDIPGRVQPGSEVRRIITLTKTLDVSGYRTCASWHPLPLRVELGVISLRMIRKEGENPR